jgi:glycolate oxidase FAD binding subunit
MIATGAIEEKLRSIVGAEHIQSAASEDAVLDVQPQFVIEPGDEQELAAALHCADEAGVAVVPRGGGTKLDWGNPPRRAELILSTARLNQVIEHAWADLTVTVEAGCTIQALQSTLAKHGQRLAIDPLWPERATVGGVLSTNDSGALRLRFGALRDLIIGVTLALPDATLARSGGKVVKNVAGYDLPKLATGALGTLGVITRAVFRLHPLASKTKTISIAAESISEMQELLLTIQDSKLAHTAFQIRCAEGAPPEADILFEATEAGLGAQAAHLATLLGHLQTKEASASCWNARQDLWTQCTDQEATLKLSVLPSEIARTIQIVQQTTKKANLRWQTVIQATGIGCLRLEGVLTDLQGAVEALRTNLAPAAGSVVILHRPRAMSTFEVWGSAGDALPLMRALKSQLDPHSTLNTGRFVGGI